MENLDEDQIKMSEDMLEGQDDVVSISKHGLHRNKSTFKPLFSSNSIFPSFPDSLELR